MSIFTKLAVNIFAPFNNDGTARQILPQDAQVWGTEIETAIDSFLVGGGQVYISRDLLYADLAQPAGKMAWVIGDATVSYNGIYRKNGGSGTGSWTRVGDLPYSFIKASNGGTGTANALQATTTIPVSEAALIVLPVVETTTAIGATVSFNGDTAKAIKTAAGNDPVAGGLTAGMMLIGIISGVTFRLLSDQASAAIQAAAEAAVIAANDAADRAEDAASNAEAIAGFDGDKLNLLLRNAALTTIYTSKSLGYRLPLASGIADGFGNLDGINTAESSGYLYDPSSNRIVNGVGPATYGPDLTTSGQAISGGDDSFGGGLLAKDKAFDNSTASGTGWASLQTGTGVGGEAYIGQDFGSAKDIRRISILQDMSADNTISKVIVQGSDDGSGWTDVATLDGLVYQSTAQVFEIPGISGGKRYWRLLASAHSVGSWGVTEIEMNEQVSAGLPTNMMVTANVYDSLDSIPATIKIVAVLEPLDVATLNTDVTMAVSRDGGVTWTDAVLTQVATLGTKVLIESGETSIASQPSGMQPAYRYETSNTKQVYLHGVALIGA